MTQTAHQRTSRDKYRRMTRGDFRAMEDGETVQVVIKSVNELETLRAQASRMNFDPAARWTVNYHRDEQIATVTKNRIQ